MFISACMIVKNEEEMLKRTLPNLVSCVDEVILVDTGSCDGTVEFARSCGAKVFNFPWINDFSAARNESLKHAQGDWIIWIDADEFIKSEDFSHLKDILTKTEEDIFKLPICECKPDDFVVLSSYPRYKVFRNSKGFHFERPINEQVCAKDGRVAHGPAIENVPIYHWGNHKSKESLQKKKERNIPILEALLKENPNDAEAHYLLGGCYEKVGRKEEAVIEYSKVAELEPSGHLTAESLAKKAWCLYNLKNIKEAYDTARTAIQIDNSEISAYNTIAACLISVRELEKAREVLTCIASLQFATRNKWQAGYLTPFLSGQLFEVSGNKDEALKSYQKAAEFDATETVVSKIKELKWA